MFVSQQCLWGVKLDHSPTIHDKNTVTIHDGIEPKTREIALIICRELTQRLFGTAGSEEICITKCLSSYKIKIWADLLPNNAKRSTSGGRKSIAPQKRLFA